MRILLIDDDVELCSLLEELLKREGFETRTEHDGARGLERARSGDFDLIVLDVMLPGLDGFEVLRQLRRSSMIPVLMLTARGEDVDRIVGLELGADDYLPKPFNPRELTARIRAISRRMEARPAGDARRLEINGVILDPGSREVFKDGTKVEIVLSPESSQTVMPEFLREVLASAKPQDWPADYALNHAHYTKGEPAR